jgi:hypothetical protein
LKKEINKKLFGLNLKIPSSDGIFLVLEFNVLVLGDVAYFEKLILILALNPPFCQTACWQ